MPDTGFESKDTNLVSAEFSLSVFLGNFFLNFRLSNHTHPHGFNQMLGKTI